MTELEIERFLDDLASANNQSLLTIIMPNGKPFAKTRGTQVASLPGATIQATTKGVALRETPFRGWRFSLDLRGQGSDRRCLRNAKRLFPSGAGLAVCIYRQRRGVRGTAW
jgi:hypothetical protein